MKSFLLVLIMSCSVFAIDSLIIPHRFADDDTIWADSFNVNYDTIMADDDRFKDTVEIEFIRFSDLEGGDSTLSRLQADTVVVGDVVVGDSARIDKEDVGVSTIDTATINYLSITDSAVGRPEIDSADITYLNVRDSLIATEARISGVLKADSIASTKISLGSATLSADSLVALIGARVVNNIAASTGTFDSIQIGGGSWITSAAIGGFVMKITEWTDTTQVVYNDSAYYYQMNDNVALSVDLNGLTLLAVSQAGSFKDSLRVSILPENLRPSTEQATYLPYNISGPPNSAVNAYAYIVTPTAAVKGKIYLSTGDLAAALATIYIYGEPTNISYSLN